MFIPMNWIEVEHALLHDDEWTGNSNAKAMIEQLLHDPVHGSIGGNGGHMTTFVSPYDPIFFLHHGFLDFVWDYWQKEQVRKHGELEQDDIQVVRALQNSAEARFGSFEPQQNWPDRFNANLVADSLAIDDDDPTTTHREVACVEYVQENHLPKPCDQDDETKIVRCIGVVQSKDKLSSIKRIENWRNNSATAQRVCTSFTANGACESWKEVPNIDVCDELNSGIQAMRTSWLNGIGINVTDIAKQNEEDDEALHEVDSLFGGSMGATDNDGNPWDQCDQTLCFSREALFDLCDKLEAESTQVSVDST